MREHGVDYPDPVGDAEGRPVVRSSAPLPAGSKTALAACRSKLPSTSTSSDQQVSQATIDRYLAIARCMRRNGVEFADPQVSDGDINVTETPADPAYRAARSACKTEWEAIGAP